MKSSVCLTRLIVPFQQDRRLHSFSSAVNRLDITRACRLRCLLSILLILCWTIAAICLINARRGERSTAEVLAQQGMIATLYSGEMARSRQAGAGNFSLFLVKAE